MRNPLALLAVASIGACGSPPAPAGHELWMAPGENEQNYILSDAKPNPY